MTSVEMPDPIIIDHTGATASVSGEIDAHTAPRLREVGDAILAEHGTVRLDLSGVTFIDSSGLGVLVALTAAARDVDGDLVVVAPSRPVVRLFEISGLVGHLTVEPA